jgi:hypothetical protein
VILKNDPRGKQNANISSRNQFFRSFPFYPPERALTNIPKLRYNAILQDHARFLSGHPQQDGRPGSENHLKKEGKKC